MPTDRWSTLTDDVSQAVAHRDRVARDVDDREAYLRRREADLVEAEQLLRDRIAALHREFPELWRYAPPLEDPCSSTTGIPPTACILAAGHADRHCGPGERDALGRTVHLRWQTS